MTQSSPEPLVDILARFDHLVEVGIGQNTTLAGALTDAGCSVTATDIEPMTVPDGVAFVIDDVTDPDPSVYDSADALYAQRLPPELQRPAFELARSLDISLYFTTLGGDPAVVPVETVTIESGTLFVTPRATA